MMSDITGPQWWCLETEGHTAVIERDLLSCTWHAQRMHIWYWGLHLGWLHTRPCLTECLYFLSSPLSEIFFLCFSFLWHHPWLCPGVTPPLHSGISPASAQGTIWDVKDQPPVGTFKAGDLPIVLSLWPLVFICLLLDFQIFYLQQLRSLSVSWLT